MTPSELTASSTDQFCKRLLSPLALGSSITQILVENAVFLTIFGSPCLDMALTSLGNDASSDISSFRNASFHWPFRKSCTLVDFTLPCLQVWI